MFSVPLLRRFTVKLEDGENDKVNGGRSERREDKNEVSDSATQIGVDSCEPFVMSQMLPSPTF